MGRRDYLKKQNVVPELPGVTVEATLVLTTSAFNLQPDGARRESWVLARIPRFPPALSQHPFTPSSVKAVPPHPVTQQARASLHLPPEAS